MHTDFQGIQSRLSTVGLRQRVISLPSNTMQQPQWHQRQLLKYTNLKMDLKIKDISDLMSESDSMRSIMQLYANTLAAITRLLEPHLQAVKEETVRYHQLGFHQGMSEESTIRSANSLDDLLRHPFTLQLASGHS